jgi:hypothetical protein
MEQGTKGSGTWVENLIYENKLYTITHEWHIPLDPFPEILDVCFENTAYMSSPDESPDITVDDLNGILASSRLVGLEKIGGKPMNHFRTTCLTGIPVLPPDLFVPVSIFSDIYVRPGRSYPWERWLQFGDGVGLDPQHDEWFLFDEWNSSPADIILPPQCQEAISKKVQQLPCRNLIEPE